MCSLLKLGRCWSTRQTQEDLPRCAAAAAVLLWWKCANVVFQKCTEAFTCQRKIGTPKLPCNGGFVGNPEWIFVEPKDKCPWICGLRAGDGLVRLSCIRKTWSDDDTVVPITSTGTSKSSSIQSTTSQSQWFFHGLIWWFSCLVSNDQKANVMCELLPEDYPPEPPNT